MRLGKLYTTCFVAVLTAAAALAQAPAAPAPKPAAPAPQQAAPKQPPAPLPAGIPALPTPSAKDAVPMNEVVLTVGPEKFTREQFEKILKGLPPQYAGVPQQIGERNFAQTYAQFRALSMKAEQEKVQESPEFQAQLKFLRDQLLATSVIQKLQLKSQFVNDDEIKSWYNAHQNEMEQAKVRAILVSLNPPAKPGAKPGEAVKRTDAEALARATELRKKLVEGADFATVAKENSDHAPTAAKGGDMGPIRKGQLPANLEKVVFSLKPKEVSEPVKEGPGYYLFQVEEVKPLTLDEASATIRNNLQQQKLQEGVEGVKKEFPVELNDKYFGAPPAAAGENNAPAKGAAKPVIGSVTPAKPAQK